MQQCTGNNSLITITSQTCKRSPLMATKRHWAPLEPSGYRAPSCLPRGFGPTKPEPLFTHTTADRKSTSRRACSILRRLAGERNRREKNRWGLIASWPQEAAKEGQDTHFFLEDTRRRDRTGGEVKPNEWRGDKQRCRPSRDQNTCETWTDSSQTLLEHFFFSCPPPSPGANAALRSELSEGGRTQLATAAGKKKRQRRLRGEPDGPSVWDGRRKKRKGVREAGVGWWGWRADCEWRPGGSIGGMGGGAQIDHSHLLTGHLSSRETESRRGDVSSGCNGPMHHVFIFSFPWG